MENTYIVAFKAGSSGRFIGNLVWGLLHEGQYEYNLTEYNSTHNFSPYATSFDISKMPNDSRPFNNHKIYSFFKFTSSPGLITVHAYPDFEVIERRFPDTKIIIVSYSEKNIPEIAANSLLKNSFERLKYTNKRSVDTKFILASYKKIFNEEYIGQYIPPSERQEIFNQYQEIVYNDLHQSKFTKNKIPDNFLHKTLILDYNEITNNMDLTLNKLCEFTNSSRKEHLDKLYKDYLSGRDRIIEEHMPWIETK